MPSLPNPAEFRRWLDTAGPWRVAGREAEYPKADQPLVNLSTGKPVNVYGLVVSGLNRLCGGDEGRHQFLKYVYGQASSRALTVRQINALYMWLHPRKFDAAEFIPVDYLAPEARGQNGDWCVRAKCKPVADAVVAAAREAAGQMELAV